MLVIHNMPGKEQGETGKAIRKQISCRQERLHGNKTLSQFAVLWDLRKCTVPTEAACFQSKDTSGLLN